MNGYEHYTEAEQLLGLLDRTEASPGVRAENFARAQTHAFLALAAAIAGGNLGRDEYAQCDRDGWDDALGADRDGTPPGAP